MLWEKASHLLYFAGWLNDPHLFDFNSPLRGVGSKGCIYEMGT